MKYRNAAQGISSETGCKRECNQNATNAALGIPCNHTARKYNKKLLTTPPG